ncbi:MAG: electron transfer flavoprotein subunit alpha [Deltaproteobacteria bacterium]|nr:electron transfer flavoprotein subunit alpha [Deltaproteobacteria bacterium]
MKEEKKKKVKKPRGVAQLIPGKCIACGARCEASCPKEAITMNDKGEPIIDVKKCIGCNKCVKVCPSEALEIYYTPEELKILAELEKDKEALAEIEAEEMDEEEARIAAKLKEYKDVWVFVEQTEGEPATVSWELLGVGDRLAQALGVKLCSIVIGSKVEALCKESFAYGAALSYLVDDPKFLNYRTEAYRDAVCHLADKYKPQILLIGATGLGRDLAGAVATKLATGLTADCTGLDIDDHGFLLQTRPAFGGNIMATIVTERHRPQMASVRPHVMPLPERDTSRTGKIIRETLKVGRKDLAVKVLEIIHDAKGKDAVDVTAAEIIVAGGAGLQAQENFSILQELAAELGGVVGASRRAVDACWMPAECQIGQTGKTVGPKIYIACGISGAIQHLVGMQGSDVIIAINNDKHAPIFEVATYGIVGDVFKIVPAITRRIRELRAQK